MRLRPTFIKLRNKRDSDIQLSKEIHQGDVGVKKFEIPKHIAGKTVKVETVLGKYQRQRFIISYKNPKTGTKHFHTVHPSCIKNTYFKETL